MTELPIDGHIEMITGTLERHRALVLTADAGAGKTTRVPPALARASWMKGQRVLVLQPRRVAAQATAARMASEWGCALGQEVGYHIRFDKRWSISSRVVVLTEGILLRMLQSDPFLSGVGAVVLDEFHERSLHTDLALALLAEVKADARPDLALLVMSASLGAGPEVASYLNCPAVSVGAPRHPSTIRYLGPQGTGREIVASTTRATLDALELLHAEGDHGHLLVFVPGAGEVQAVLNALRRSDQARQATLLPLFGALPIEAQTAALEPSTRRKIVVATNIAETSLTVEGLAVVVDSGWERRLRYDPRRGFDRLELVRITAASAQQRAGRVGRTRSGRVVRLWSEEENARLAAAPPPEVRCVKLTRAALEVRAWSGRTAAELPWFEAPDGALLADAEAELQALGAISDQDGLTERGRKLLELPLEPRLGNLILEGARRGAIEPAAALAAWLSEGNANLAGALGSEDGAVDAMDLRRAWNGGPQLGPAVARWRRVGSELASLAARQMCASTAPPATPAVEAWSSEGIGRLAIATFADCVAQRRRPDGPELLLAKGTGAALPPRLAQTTDSVWWVALDVGGGPWRQSGTAQVPGVGLALPVAFEWIEEESKTLLRTESRVAVDSSGSAFEETTTALGSLVLRSSRRRATASEATTQALLAYLEREGKARLDQDSHLGPLLQRWRWLLGQGAPLPSIEPSLDAAVRAHAGRATTANEVVRALASHAPWTFMGPADIAILEEWAPTSIAMPSGRRASVSYSEDTAPTLSAPLQEFFGWAQGPSICGGRVPIRLELLAPSGRPAQVTSDLARFWATSYAEVRKDLRGRYPKHYWPENPAEAQYRRAGRGKSNAEP